MGPVHHLNCGTLCPPAARFTIGSDHLVCHCLLIETAGDGLVLVDTGLGTRDADRIPRPTNRLLGCQHAPAETAIAQVIERGFDPGDVRHIVLTHLDLDHAGGLSDFPEAEVHVHAAECYAATCEPTAGERRRYIRRQMDHDVHWHTYSDAGDAWMGLEAVRTLDGLTDDVVLVPLFGHTRGHSGVAVRDGDRWLLHAGDAYFHRGDLDAPPTSPRGLRAFEDLNVFDRPARDANLDRLRALHAHNDEVAVFCAHDPVEFEKLR